MTFELSVELTFALDEAPLELLTLDGVCDVVLDVTLCVPLEELLPDGDDGVVSSGPDPVLGASDTVFDESVFEPSVLDTSETDEPSALESSGVELLTEPVGSVDDCPPDKLLEASDGTLEPTVSKGFRFLPVGNSTDSTIMAIISNTETAAAIWGHRFGVFSSSIICFSVSEVIQ